MESCCTGQQVWILEGSATDVDTCAERRHENLRRRLTAKDYRSALLAEAALAAPGTAIPLLKFSATRRHGDTGTARCGDGESDEVDEFQDALVRDQQVAFLPHGGAGRASAHRGVMQDSGVRCPSSLDASACPYCKPG